MSLNNDQPQDPQLPNPDPIMDALKRANPVAARDVPTAQSAAAKSLLAEVTSRPAGAGFDSYSAPAEFAKPERADQPGRYRFLAAVAVAIAVVAAGISFVLPGSSQPAIAAVQAAATETQKAISGEVLTSVSFEGSDATESGQLQGSVNVLFDADDIAVIPGEITVEGDGFDANDDEDLNELEDVELRYVDGIAYVKADGEWMGIDAPGFIGEMVIAEYINPTKVLAEVNSLTDATEIGSETVDGVDTTHYQSEINMAEGETFNATGWLGEIANELALEADGVVVIDLYVGDDGLLRLMNITADIESTDPAEEGEATIQVSTKFSNLNGDVNIEAPEGVEVMDMGDLGDELEEEFGEEFDN